MAEPQSIEEFEHLHRDAMVRLENEQLKLENMHTPPGLEPLDIDLRQTLTTIRQIMPRSGRLDPEEIFQKAMSSLSAVDAQRFLMDNLLEALKRGDSLDKLMDRYKALGLISESLPPNDRKISTVNLGGEVEKRKGLWRRVAMTVIQIGVNAVKSIPKWIEIEPQIMLVGPVPAISFTLKGTGMTIQDLIETLCRDTELGTMR